MDVPLPPRQQRHARHRRRPGHARPGVPRRHRARRHGARGRGGRLHGRLRQRRDHRARTSTSRSASRRARVATPARRSTRTSRSAGRRSGAPSSVGPPEHRQRRSRRRHLRLRHPARRPRAPLRLGRRRCRRARDLPRGHVVPAHRHQPAGDGAPDHLRHRRPTRRCAGTSTATAPTSPCSSETAPGPCAPASRAGDPVA